MKFNKPSSTVTKTANKAGGEAFKESPKLELVSLMLTSFVSDQFYSKQTEQIDRMKDLIQKISDKEFVAKAAIYGRTKFGMRSITHVAAGEIFRDGAVSGKSWAKTFIEKVVYRPDDAMEIMAYFAHNVMQKTIPSQLKKGMAKALQKFNSYELGKYRGERKEFSLVDIANLTHPKSSEHLDALMNGTLKSTDTWETKLTQAGQNAENEDEKDDLKKEAWRGLIKERKIGYFALLRNLRNILEQAPELVPDVCELLVDENLIRKSLVLPFRYLKAIEEIEKLNGSGVRQILVAISKATDICLANVPKFEGKTLVVLDTSGSMSGKPISIGALFAAVLYKANEADLITFDSDARYVSLNPLDTTATLQNRLIKEAHGGGTNFHSIFETANQAYARIIILSDMQGWIGYHAPTSSLAEYKKRTGANPKIYSFDLQGYGTLEFPQNDVFAIAGFSEKILDLMKLLEQDKNALIHEIEKVEL